MRQLRQDHPRSRGVYSVTRPVMNAVGRIIPARAGFTRCCRWLSASWPDHPRSRGVYRTTRVSRPHPTGLSPLARGLQAHNPPVYHTNRIIPARAGFTSTENLAQKIAADHPRSRGVYFGAREGGFGRGGSSPLARGLLRGPRGRIRSRWIIPARAGFTSLSSAFISVSGDHPRSRGVYGSRPSGSQKSGDHPRSRGVYQLSYSNPDGNLGSSPLARGLLVVESVGGAAGRIIPARAGFTSTVAQAVKDGSDHPRSRGVYVQPVDGLVRVLGSSPLARGLRPARRRSCPRTPDHPRSRGVYPQKSKFPGTLEGSSPLARGLRRRHSRPRRRRRIIPARAGFT